MTIKGAIPGRTLLAMALAAIVAEVLGRLLVPRPARMVILPLLVLLSLEIPWLAMRFHDGGQTEEHSLASSTPATSWKELPPAHAASVPSQRKRLLLRMLLRCALYSICLQLGTLALNYLSLRLFSWLPPGVASESPRVPLELLLFSSCLLAPLAEELFYRLALPGAVQHLGGSPRGSAIFCSLAFAFAHCAPRALPALFFLGYALDGLARRRGVQDAILAHAFYNAESLLLMRLLISCPL